MARETILVIEDEEDILEVITYNLSREGYRVAGSRNGEEGLERARGEMPDLVLLDLMLPGVDGLEVCRRLKADPALNAIPIVMVTAKGEESDIVLGLGLGADDYVTKPFSPKELVARVKAVLRRGPVKESPVTGERIIRGKLVVDPLRHEVLLDGKPVSLTATEFRLLHFLAAHPGRVFTREALVSQAIGGDVVVDVRNIDVHLRALRRKLASGQEFFETVRGVGYRFQDPET